MSITIRSLLCAAACVMLTSVAVAEEPKPDGASRPNRTQRAPKRRVEKHSADRSSKVKGESRVVVIPGVVVVGRPGRPLSVFESSTTPFVFPIGTVRYSSADRRFVRPGAADRW